MQVMIEVANPSALFIAGRDQHAAGAAIFAGMEGTRPLLCEIQALAHRFCWLATMRGATYRPACAALVSRSPRWTCISPAISELPRNLFRFRVNQPMLLSFD